MNSKQIIFIGWCLLVGTCGANGGAQKATRDTAHVCDWETHKTVEAVENLYFEMHSSCFIPAWIQIDGKLHSVNK